MAGVSYAPLSSAPLVITGFVINEDDSSVIACRFVVGPLLDSLHG